MSICQFQLLYNMISIITMGFPGGSAGKESTCNAGDLGSIPGFGRSPGEGKGYALQYSGLENSMDCIIHGVAKSQTRLRDFHFHNNDSNRCFFCLLISIKMYRNLRLKAIYALAFLHSTRFLNQHPKCTPFSFKSQCLTIIWGLPW